MHWKLGKKTVKGQELMEVLLTEKNYYIRNVKKIYQKITFFISFFFLVQSKSYFL